MKIAVITGASSGMGRDFARQLDAGERFDQIWLIARRTERLAQLAEELTAPCRCLSLDLTDPAAIREYQELLASQQPEVAVLVNAAGFGLFKAFTEATLEQQLSMVDLNDKAMLSLTHSTLPYMREGGRVYLLSSMSSIQPVPLMAVYAASKAFVQSFSRALRAEVAPRGIRVMAVCPYYVRTEFFDTAKTDDTVSHIGKLWESADVVRTALRDMARGREVSCHGCSTKLQRLGVKILPHKLVVAVWCKQQGLKRP